MNASNPAKLGWRYLLGHKLSNGVTRAAAAGISVGTAAMIIVLSAFNGLESLVKSSFDDVHPIAEIFSKKEGRFLPDSLLISNLNTSEHHWFPILEQKALIRSNQKEILVDVIGIPFDELESFVWLDSLTSELSIEPYDRSIWLGSEVALKLGFIELNGLSSVQLLWPRNNQIGILNGSDPFFKETLNPQAIFRIHSKIDSKNVLVPLNSLKTWGQDQRWSSIQIWETQMNERSPNSIIKELEILLKDSPYEVRSAESQEAAIFSVMKSEGLMTSAILALIVLLASLGLYSSTILTGMERESQSAILSALGFSKSKIRQSFFWTGTWVSAFGSLLGLLVASVAIWGQSTYGLISLGEGYIVKAYPVEFSLIQSIQVCVYVIVIGMTLSALAAGRVSISTSRLREKP